MNDSAPQPDYLGSNAQLRAQCELSVLGWSCIVRSNNAALIQLAVDSFAAEPIIPASRNDPLRVDVIVHGNPEATLTEPLRLTYRSHSGHLLAASGEILLSADGNQGYGLAFIPPALLADPANLRYNVLELLTLWLAGHRDRTPVHAAALAHADRAIVLAGNSGIGKSTLAYSAIKAGLRLLAEDAVYVALEGEARLWGHPRRLHLLPDGPRFFPELAGIVPQVQANGKLKLAVELPTVQLISNARPAGLCLIERVAGQASHLHPIAPDEAVATLLAAVEPGFHLLADRLPAALQAIAAPGAYRLQVGDPRSAVALIATLLEQL